MKNKIWIFLNSKLGLWLLSSIVLSGLTFSYSIVENMFHNNNARNEEIRKIDLELQNRLYVFGRALTRNQDKEMRKKIADIVGSLASPDKSNYPIYVFEEYKNRTTQSLIWELHSLVEDSEKKKIREAAIVTRGMIDILEMNSLIGTSEFSYDNEKHVVKVVLTAIFDIVALEELKKMNLERWEKPFDKYISSFTTKK